MKKHIFALLLPLSILACEPSTTEPDCETTKTGTMTISNSSQNPYDFYINDVFKARITGGTITNKISIPQGNNIKFYAKQVSGYLLVPTERTIFFNVISCSNYSWQIP